MIDLRLKRRQGTLFLLSLTGACAGPPSGSGEPVGTVEGAVTPGAYIGCYADSSTRDLSYQAYSGSATATVQACIAACTSAGYKYAGAQDGNQCFCGNSYGSHGTSSNCTMACAGNSSETCGGAWANSVYSTGK